MNQAVKDGLIVALDIESADDALAIFEDLRISVGIFKVGMQLFIAAVPDLVRQIVGRVRWERISQLAWCGEGCFDSRRRVNSAVMRLACARRTNENTNVRNSRL